MQSKEEYQYLPELQKIFSKIELVYHPFRKSVLNCAFHAFSKTPFQVLYFKSYRFKKSLATLLQENRYDAIHVQHLRMAQYLASKKNYKRILDMPDAFSLYWQRRKQTKRPIWNLVFDAIESKRVEQYESILTQFDQSLVCSIEDLDFLKQSHPNASINLLPNGVDLETFTPMQHDYDHNKTLLFTGNMDYAPNIDAVQYFVKDIFPLILNEFPDTKFIIAGQRPVEKVQALAAKNILVTGFVPNLAEAYNSASVVVAPLRFGAGTQNKVLEAMAMGIPVVCSNIGFKGLGIESGEGAFMHQDATGFANRVKQLLDDKDLRQKTGNKGIEIIQQQFSWDIIAKKLENYFFKLSN